MRPYTKYSLTFAAVLLFLMGAAGANAQDARLNFEKLNGLDKKANDVVVVTIDGNLLNLAKRVTAKLDDDDAKKIAKAISGLKGIYVRAYRFQNENEYNAADVDEIRAQLSGPGWERLANVRSKKNDQKVDVYTMFTGGMMSGVAVVISDSKSIALVNVIGPIDIDTLVELSGKLNIPKIDIEHDTSTKPKPKTDKE